MFPTFFVFFEGPDALNLMSKICENVCSALVFHFGSRRKTFWDVLSGSDALSNVENMLDGYLSNDTLRSAPAAERNKAPILEVIRAI